MSNIETFVNESDNSVHIRKTLDRGVKIEVSIPRNQISDEFDQWEEVLNAWLTVVDQSTSEFVESTARLCHEANRILQLHSDGDVISPTWNAAPDWQKESSREGVRKALQGQTPEQLHESWLEFKLKDGWVYGVEKDEYKKTHPCMVRYEDLPEDQQIKDDMFHAIVQTQLKNIIHTPRKM